MESGNVIELGLIQMISAFAFVLVLVIIEWKRKIGGQTTVLIASLRMTLQLTLTGYLLVWIFKNPSPWITVLVIIIMEAFSVFNAFKRSKNPLSPALKKSIAFSLVTGTLICLLYFLFVVVRIKPWFNPRYFIPLAGMLIGNSMTGVSLGLNIMTDAMENDKDRIEAALMLGASPYESVRSILDRAFDSAVLPSINTMMGTGIVFLPGMMTGQILSGESPLSAISYQIAILLGILGSVSITVILLVETGYRTFFNGKKQLIKHF